MPISWGESSKLRLLMAVIMSTKENTTYDWNKIAEMLDQDVTASAARQQFQKIKNGLGKDLSSKVTSAGKSPAKSSSTPRKRKDKVVQDDDDDDEYAGSSPTKKPYAGRNASAKQETFVKREDSPDSFDREHTVGAQESCIIDAEDLDNV